jgi:hypothetical protein
MLAQVGITRDDEMDVVVACVEKNYYDPFYQCHHLPSPETITISRLPKTMILRARKARPSMLSHPVIVGFLGVIQKNNSTKKSCNF